MLILHIVIYNGVFLCTAAKIVFEQTDDKEIEAYKDETGDKKKFMD